MSSLLGREITRTAVYLNTVTPQRIGLVILLNTLPIMCMDDFIPPLISVYFLATILSAYIAIMIACLVVIFHNIYKFALLQKFIQNRSSHI